MAQSTKPPDAHTESEPQWLETAKRVLDDEDSNENNENNESGHTTTAHAEPAPAHVSSPPDADAETIQALREQVDVLTSRIGILEETNAKVDSEPQRENNIKMSLRRLLIQPNNAPLELAAGGDNSKTFLPSSRSIWLHSLKGRPTP